MKRVPTPAGPRAAPKRHRASPAPQSKCDEGDDVAEVGLSRTSRATDCRRAANASAKIKTNTRRERDSLLTMPQEREDPDAATMRSQQVASHRTSGHDAVSPRFSWSRSDLGRPESGMGRRARPQWRSCQRLSVGGVPRHQLGERIGALVVDARASDAERASRSGSTFATGGRRRPRGVVGGT